MFSKKKVKIKRTKRKIKPRREGNAEAGINIRGIKSRRLSINLVPNSKFASLSLLFFIY